MSTVCAPCHLDGVARNADSMVAPRCPLIRIMYGAGTGSMRPCGTFGRVAEYFATLRRADHQHPPGGQSAASGRGGGGFGGQRHDRARIGAASGGSGTANAFSRNEISV